MSADLTWALRINNAAQPAVNGLGATELDELVAWAEHFLVAESGGERAGFVLALPGPGLAYASLNYTWFARRFTRFLYVDRIVVDAGARSSGSGTALYTALAEVSRGRWPRICAEVNIRPPNPGSLRFHERAGFHAVGEQDTEGGAKRVRLLECPLPGERC